MEKAREATDMANIRAAYAEVSTDALTNTDSTSIKSLYVTATQTQDKWGKNDTTDIGGIQVNAAYKATGATHKGWTIKYDNATSKVTITPEATKPEGALDYPSNN